MNKMILRGFVILTFIMAMISGVQAQSRRITGTVTSKGEALPGVSIQIKGTATGTISDAGGNYSITAADGQILKFSFIGFQEKEVTLQGQSRLDISLEETQIALDEVVAIGYGKAKKGDLTSSITSVKGEEMRKMTVGNPVQALQGKAPGVQVITGSGAPGSSPKVLIRGFTSINLSTDPLYIVDGVPMGSNLNFLNTNEVESIQVLKDASASAIYGSRASNGVVLITTKRGAAGKTSFNTDVTFGYQKFDKPYDMVDAEEYAKIMNQSLVNGGLAERFPDPASLGRGTDWWGEGVNRFSPQMNFSFQASGGTAKHQYAVSLNYYDQSSFYNSGDWKKFTARLSNDWNFSPVVSAGIVLNPRREYWHNIPSWYQDYLLIDPITPIYVPEDEREGLNEFSIYERSYYTYTWNPIARDARNFGRGGYYALGSNAYLDIKPFKGFQIRSQISSDLKFNRTDNFTPEFSIDEAHESSKINAVERNMSNDVYWNWTNTATYDFSENEHNVTAMVGGTFEKWTGTNLWGKKEGVPNNTDLLREIDAGTLNPTTGGTHWEQTIESFLGRVSYNYAGTYYLTGTYRVDGSSKFMANNKWATFPSVSAAWRISKASFLKSATFVDDLKIRAGWGRLGNQGLPSNVYASGIGQYYYIFGPGEGDLVNTTYPTSMKNEDIKWETVEDINLGTDFTLFELKVDGSVEYYRKKTKDMLFLMPYPNYSGFPDDARIWSNIGSMESKGWDIAVNYHGSVSELKYNLGLTLMTVQVEATDLPDITPVIYGSNNYTRTVEGEVPGYYFGYRTSGLFQNQTEINSHSSEHGALLQPVAKPGDIRFEDTNSDGVLNADDRVKIGSPWPDFTGGFNLDMSYKNFDLIANVYFSVGNELVNWNKRNLYRTTGSSNNVISGLLDKAWHGEGTGNDIPRVSHVDHNENYTRFSDFFVEDGSFARLKNLQLGYTLPASLSSKWGLSKCRFYISGQNILTITGYDGVEPEVSGGVLDLGFGEWQYPVLPTYLIGVNVAF